MLQVKDLQKWRLQLKPERVGSDHLPHTLKNGSLLVFVVSWRNFNIHEIFPLHKKLFIEEKKSILTIKIFFAIRNNASFKNCSLNGSFGNPEWFFHDIAVHPFGTFILV